MAFYRILSNGTGIYEAVEKDCPRADPRRLGKPDGSWLPRVGPKFPGAISFWTEQGFERYLRSGLCEWHRSVVEIPPKAIVLDQAHEALYTDEYQVIVDALASRAQELSLDELLIDKAAGRIVSKVVLYLTRADEVLVFEHDKEFREAGLQVPAGTVEPGESIEQAAHRELLEESGISGARDFRLVDNYMLFRAHQQQFQHRSIAHLRAPKGVPNRFMHLVSAGDSDKGRRFGFFWLPIAEARMKLAGGFGSSLAMLGDCED